jgi:hypothetical protein
MGAGTEQIDSKQSREGLGLIGARMTVLMHNTIKADYL